MTSKNTNGSANLQIDLDEWKAGAKPMTNAQKSHRQTLSREAGRTFNENLTKAEAATRIKELQKKTGRGQPKLT